MKIVVVSGSHRARGESNRVADYLAGLARQQLGAETSVLKLSALGIPLWQDDDDPRVEAVRQAWAPVKAELASADAWILVTPEWNGMAPPGVKNFLLLCSAREVGHKPCLLAAVSASRGGSYPIVELRQSGYKNTRVLYLPEHLIFQSVATLLVGDQPANENDAYIRRRSEAAVTLLGKYATALAPIRDGIWDYKAFGNGMLVSRQARRAPRARARTCRAAASGTRPAPCSSR